MATNLDLTQSIRGKILSALKADADLIAVVAAARIYPQTVPAALVFPFVKMGAPITTPQFIDGKNGSSFSAAVHCFTKKKISSPAAPSDVLDPEAQAMQINNHIVRVLDLMEGVSIGEGLTLDVIPRQTQIMQDGDADSYHGFVTFDAFAS